MNRLLQMMAAGALVGVAWGHLSRWQHWPSSVEFVGALVLGGLAGLLLRAWHERNDRYLP